MFICTRGREGHVRKGCHVQKVKQMRYHFSVLPEESQVLWFCM